MFQQLNHFQKTIYIRKVFGMSQNFKNDCCARKTIQMQTRSGIFKNIKYLQPKNPIDSKFYVFHRSFNDGIKKKPVERLDDRNITQKCPR